tara:strand:- start:125 stop:847 length:723 start_codon:yes stop_codon:yes gene_type:complete
MLKIFRERVSALLILGLLTSGCAPTYQVSQIAPPETKHVLIKNIEVGVISTARVGEPIVKVEDYHVVEYTRTALVEAGAKNERSKKILQVDGEVEINGERFIMAGCYDQPNQFGYTKWCVPVRKADLVSLTNKSLFVYSTGAKIVDCRKVCIPETRFETYDDKEVDTTRGYINFELLYSGTSSDSIKVDYREYSPDNLARTAFYQTLTYDKSDKYITYKNIKLEVISADSSEIKVRVIEY